MSSNWKNFLNRLEANVRELDAIKIPIFGKEGVREGRSEKKITLYGPRPPSIDGLLDIQRLTKNYRLMLETKASGFGGDESQALHYEISLIQPD